MTLRVLIFVACLMLFGCAQQAREINAVKIDLANKIDGLQNELAAKVRWRSLKLRDEIMESHDETRRRVESAERPAWAVFAALILKLGYDYLSRWLMRRRVVRE